MRLRGDACEVLQTACEDLLTNNFKKCSKLAEICKTDTIKTIHWGFVTRECEPCSDKN